MAIQESARIETVQRGDRLAEVDERGRVKLRKVQEVTVSPAGCLNGVHVQTEGRTECWEMGYPTPLLRVTRAGE